MMQNVTYKKSRVFNKTGAETCVSEYSVFLIYFGNFFIWARPEAQKKTHIFLWGV